MPVTSPTTPVKEVTVYAKKNPTPSNNSNAVGTSDDYKARIDSTNKANQAADAASRASRGAKPLPNPDADMTTNASRGNGSSYIRRK